MSFRLKKWPNAASRAALFVAFLALCSSAIAQSLTGYGVTLQPGETIVSMGNYSHFPRSAQGSRGRIGVVYYHGLNHGSANEEAVARLQRTSEKDEQLALNGGRVSDGIARLRFPSQLIIRTEGEESQASLTIVGTGVDGSPLVEGEVSLRSKLIFTRNRFLSVSKIRLDGSLRGRIRIGVRVEPGNVEFRYTDDEGKTWSDPYPLGDGLSRGDGFHYAPSLGGLPDGTFVATFLRSATTDGKVELVERISLDNGATWAPTKAFNYSGAKPKTTLYIDHIQATPLGRLVATGYAGPDNWVFVSDDKGQTWYAHLIVSTDSKVDYNEMGLAVVSESNWVGVARVNSGAVPGSLRQFVTHDAGLSWRDLGPTNVDPAGGYVSPGLQVVRCGRQPVLALAYMARSARFAQPPNPNSIVLRFATVASVMNTARSWTPEQVISTAGTFPVRSGYPTIEILKDCKSGLILMGRETSFTTADVVSFVFGLPTNWLE